MISVPSGLDSVVFDLGSTGINFNQNDPITYPCELIGLEYNGVQLVNAPIPIASVNDIVALMTSGSPNFNWFNQIEPQFAAHGPTTGSGGAVGGLIFRPFQSEPIFDPPTLYDPASSNPRENGFSVMTFNVGGQTKFVVPQVLRSRGGYSTMSGPLSAWSYHGPLHYGLSATHHPYKVDKVFKQVHAGMGYDVPLHLLIPPAVHVRARNGFSGAIELEMETPFHRTDNLANNGGRNSVALDNGIAPTSGFTVIGDNDRTGVINQRNPTLGQYYLRTNLWDSPAWSATPDALTLAANNQRVKGPVVVRNPSHLEAFWSDHPTDHFHASAMPILQNTDYDLAAIQTANYTPLMLARIQEMSNKDVLTIGEQLSSSVDVHIGVNTRPYWDSGSIVSGQGCGPLNNIERGNYPQYLSKHEANFQEMTGNPSIQFPFLWSAGNAQTGYGKGQRIIRTPDGTTHIFMVKRSLKANSGNNPVWTHMKKTPNGDLFWNKRAYTTNNFGFINQVHNMTTLGEDECGPIWGTNIIMPPNSHESARSQGKVYGASFCSDSKGTIHAVFEVHLNNGDSEFHRSHQLWYQRCERITVSQSPEPVYDWDWTRNPPTLVNDGDLYVGGSLFDLRTPSIVCDSKDRIHLVVSQIYVNMADDGSTQNPFGQDVSQILYTSKAGDEPNFPPLDMNADTTINNGGWSRVSDLLLDESDVQANNPANSNHKTRYAIYPKICLRSDDIPVVFWYGSAGASYTTSSRRDMAVYVNVGEKSPEHSLIVFNRSKAIHALGLLPQPNINHQDNDVIYYDAIVDENDKGVIVAIKDDAGSGITVKHQVSIVQFNTRLALAKQYSATTGLGDSRTLLSPPIYDGTTEMRNVNTHYNNPTLTTNGRGEYHLVLGFTIDGTNPDSIGATFRDASLPKTDESSVNALGFPSVPKSAGSVAQDGYAKSAAVSPSWPNQYGGPSTFYGNKIYHFLQVWFPSYEFDDDATAADRVIRSVNMKWLSVPSLTYDATKGWQPIGSAQTMSGEENFPHLCPQLRYQRYWGHNAAEIDLTWRTNELSWIKTPHQQSQLYLPQYGLDGQTRPDSDPRIQNDDEVAGYPLTVGD